MRSSPAEAAGVPDLGVQAVLLAKLPCAQCAAAPKAPCKLPPAMPLLEGGLTE